MKKKLVVLMALAVVTAACDNSGPVSQTKEITKTQALSDALPPPAKIPTSAERFGTDPASHSGAMPGGMPGGMPGAAPGMAGGMGAKPAISWTWTKPDGWDEAPATQFRIANFKVSGNPETECYLSMAQGGIEANANRWRKQMGQADYTLDEFAKLPRKTILGQQAITVGIDGTYGGMGGSEKKEGYKLLGAMFEYEGTGVFVKMTGPAAVVDKEQAHFDAFVDSLKPGADGAAPAAAPSMAGALPAGHPTGEVTGMVDGSGAPFKWDAPAGWTKGADRPMRVVTYTTGASGKTECVISMLTGAAGGAEANINRWRGQMGQSALSAAEIAAMPKVKVLGQDSPLVEVSGPYTGMDGGQQTGYMLLGALGEVPGNKVFIKMVGPEAEVKAEKEHFIAFCQSLK